MTDNNKPLPLGEAHHYDRDLMTDDVVARTLVDLSEFLIEAMPKVAAGFPGNDGEANGSDWLDTHVCGLREALDNEFGFAVGEVRYHVDMMLETFQSKLDATLGVPLGRDFTGTDAKRYMGKSFRFQPEILSIVPAEQDEDDFPFKSWWRLAYALKMQVEYIPLATDDTATWVGYWEPDHVMSGHDTLDDWDWASVGGRLLGVMVVWGKYHHGDDIGRPVLATSRQNQGIEDQMIAFARNLDTNDG